MKNQLKGINFILFGIILMLFSIIDPWIPIFEEAILLIPWAGVVCGIIGLRFSLKNEDE